MALVFIRPISIRLGAEEQDAASVEKYLAVLNDDVHVFELSKQSKTLHYRCYNFGTLVSENEIKLSSRSSAKNHVARILVLDAAARAYLKLNIAETIHLFLKEKKVKIRFLVTHTSALVGVASMMKAETHVSRSVNFEPLHYLQENRISIKSPLVFLSKVWLTFFERSNAHVWVISPNDMKKYAYFCSAKSIDLYPLFQLFEMSTLGSDNSSKVINVGFLGSTFNVSHNRASFDFIAGELAPALLKCNQKLIHFNVYGVKSPIKNPLSNLTIHGWKESIGEIFQENDLFLIPYFGGTGMQSKLFEPLMKGKPVIADPRAFAGYPFVANEHYFAATSVGDYTELLNRLASREVHILSLVGNSDKLVKQLFSKERLLSKMRVSLGEP